MFDDSSFTDFDFCTKSSGSSLKLFNLNVLTFVLIKITLKRKVTDYFLNKFIPKGKTGCHLIKNEALPALSATLPIPRAFNIIPARIPKFLLFSEGKTPQRNEKANIIFGNLICESAEERLGAWGQVLRDGAMDIHKKF